MKATIFHGTKQLQEHELLPVEASCPFCSSENRTNVAPLQKNPDVNLLRCNNCHAVSASRIPTSSALASYYTSYYDDRNDKVTHDTPMRLASHIFYSLQKYQHNSTRELKQFNILDFGGGDGSISLSIAEKLLLSDSSTTVAIDLVEYNAAIKIPDNRRISLTATDSLQNLQGKKFPLVIASAIIEHLPEPSVAINSLLTALEKDGVMYIRTPAMLPFISLASKLGMHFDFSFPGHIHDLGFHFWNNFIQSMNIPENYTTMVSRPSLVETSFSQHFFRTLLATLLKVPGFIFPSIYPFVGGWEIVIKRTI